jgi:5-methylthioribose kinase
MQMSQKNWLYLQQLKWLDEQETIVSLSKPGEGNMNCVLRVETATRSFIVKQSRGYVEKYPQVLAPASRVLTEGALSKNCGGRYTANHAEALGIDAINNMIALEDLGKPMISLFYMMKKKITRTGTQPISRLFEWFAPKIQKTVVDDELVNTELRTLNYEHILNILLKKKMDSTLMIFRMVCRN